MSSVSSANSSLELNPLLTPDDLKPAAPVAEPGLLTQLQNRLKNRIEAWKARHWKNPVGRKRTQKWGAIALIAVLLSGGGAYWKWGMVHKPDFETDDLDDVLDYTLLTDDFNRLPIEDRLKLISELIKRMKSSDGEQSAMMAAFMAGISGKARDQLMANSSKVAIDLFDKYARKYDQVKDEDREKYLEDSFVDMMKQMEAMGGVVRDVPDEQRLDEVRRQAQRDKTRIEAGKGPGGAMAGRMIDFMQKNVANKASPEQRGRGAAMMRDMGRYFRGEDIKTGKPLPQGPPPAPRIGPPK